MGNGFSLVDVANNRTLSQLYLPACESYGICTQVCQNTQHLAAQEQIHQHLLPVQIFWGWAEADHRVDQGLQFAAGCAAVWSDVGEDRYGQLAAAGDGDGDDDVDVD